MYIKLKNNCLELSIYLQPNSKQNKILGLYDNQLKISITAPAIEGKANKFLIEWLSSQLKIAKTRITIDKGNLNRHKKVIIEDIKEIPEILKFN